MLLLLFLRPPGPSSRLSNLDCLSLSRLSKNFLLLPLAGLPPPDAGAGAGLSKDSVVLLEQIRTIDKTRLKEKMGHLDDVTMDDVDNAIQISFGITGAEG